MLGTCEPCLYGEESGPDGPGSGDECPPEDPWCNGPGPDGPDGPFGPDGPTLPQELDVDVTMKLEDGTELNVVHIKDNSGIFMGPMMGDMIG